MSLHGRGPYHWPSVGNEILNFFHTAGRSCHLYGLFLRFFSWPLTIMLSADMGPVICARSRGAMAQMGLSRSLGRLAWVRYEIRVPIPTW